MRFILAKYQSFWLIVVIYGSPCHIFTHFHLLLLIISQYGSWWFTLAHCASVWILLFRVMYCDLLSLSWAHLFWLIMTHYCSFLLIAAQSNLMWLIKDHFCLSWLISSTCESLYLVQVRASLLWLILGYYGLLRLILAHSGSSCFAVAHFFPFWLILAHCGSSRFILAHCGWIWLILAHCCIRTHFGWLWLIGTYFDYLPFFVYPSVSVVLFWLIVFHCDLIQASRLHVVHCNSYYPVEAHFGSYWLSVVCSGFLCLFVTYFGS